MFQKGSIFGIGPGGGSVTSQLPDVHAGFVFSVAREELGVIFCCAVVAIFGFIVFKMMFSRCSEA